ncbi:hypothetical protein HDU76_009843 [Blyttiomyces sp. JEL0837]|nr:hypothetical protein HDU76_009843 [Blyttiomyces sp. JEL0837]
MMYTVSSAGYFVAAAVLGYYADLVNKHKKMISIVSGFLFLCAIGIAAFLKGVAVLLVTFIGYSLVVEVFAASKSSSKLGVALFFFSFGKVVGPFLGGVMADRISLSAPLVFGMGISALDLMLRFLMQTTSREMHVADASKMGGVEDIINKTLPISSNLAAADTQQFHNNPTTTSTSIRQNFPILLEERDNEKTRTGLVKAINPDYIQPADINSKDNADNATIIVTDDTPSRSTSIPPTSTSDLLTKPTTSEPPKMSTVLEILSVLGIHIVGLSFFLVALVQVAFESVYGIHLHTKFSMSPGQIGLISLISQWQSA